MTLQQIVEFLKTGRTMRAVMVCTILIVGWIAANFLSRSLTRVAKKHFATHQVMLIKRLSYYLLVALTIITALNEAGINLSVVIGAAGVASVAIGFASQTSMSNLISGIFMIIEKPFMVSDTVRVGSTTGEVISMGLLSTILKTADNIMVRIPNENLMKSEIANITRFTTRKFDVAVGVSYTANLNDVKNLLINAVSSLDLILKEPRPSVQFDKFGESSMDLVVSCWSRQDRLGDARFEAAQALKQALEAAKIDIPFPQRVLTIPEGLAETIKS